MTVKITFVAVSVSCRYQINCQLNVFLEERCKLMYDDYMTRITQSLCLTQVFRDDKCKLMYDDYMKRITPSLMACSIDLFIETKPRLYFEYFKSLPDW